MKFRFAKMDALFRIFGTSDMILVTLQIVTYPLLSKYKYFFLDSQDFNFKKFDFILILIKKIKQLNSEIKLKINSKIKFRNIINF